MNRIDQLPENQLVTTLLEARKNLDDLKSRQYTSGRSGVLGYMTASSSTWDYNASVSNTSPAWKVTFTGDGSQRFPMVNAFADVFVNDQSHRLSYTQNFYNDGTNYVSVYHFMDRDSWTPGFPPLSDPLQMQWRIELDVSGTVNILIKVYVLGSSPGTLTVTRVA